MFEKFQNHNTRKQVRNLERDNHSIHNNNREVMKEGEEISRIEGRMKKMAPDDFGSISS
jgi:SMC interacting uncharacterized protein involved in chromosome segregation